MYIPSALVAGVFALQASAFLIPLEIENAAKQFSSYKAEISKLVQGNAVKYNLDCPGCPFFNIVDGEPVWEKDVDNEIALVFDTDQKKGLLVNGNPARPVDDYMVSVTARQVSKQDGRVSMPLDLTFVLERLMFTINVDEPDKKIENLLFTINAIAGYPVKVDSLAIDLLETEDSTTVAKIEKVPFETTPGATTCDTSSRWSLCRLRAIIRAHFERFMAAAKAHAQTAKGWTKGNCPKGGRWGRYGGKGEHRGHHGHHGPHGPHAHGPHQHGPHHHGGHHFRAHRFGHMLHQALRFFVIPILLGIVGGLTASAIGMLVGQLIVSLWIRFYRNGQRGPVPRVVEIVVQEDEKDALLDEKDDEIESPPEYQDVEATVVVVDEKN